MHILGILLTVIFIIPTAHMNVLMGTHMIYTVNKSYGCKKICDKNKVCLPISPEYLDFSLA